MNKKIANGTYRDKMMFDIMKTATRKDLSDFLDFVIGWPGKYAGNDWKLSEIFATWLIAGAPK